MRTLGFYLKKYIKTKIIKPNEIKIIIESDFNKNSNIVLKIIVCFIFSIIILYSIRICCIKTQFGFLRIKKV